MLVDRGLLAACLPIILKGVLTGNYFAARRKLSRGGEHRVSSVSRGAGRGEYSRVENIVFPGGAAGRGGELYTCRDTSRGAISSRPTTCCERAESFQQGC